MRKTIAVLFVLFLLFALPACEKKCEHTYREEITREPTCAEAGIKTYTCTLCNESYTEQIPTLEHIFGQRFASKHSTCIENGEVSAKCTVCGNTEVVGELELASHKYVSQVTVPATCTTEGVRVYTCSICGDSYQKEVAKSSHKYTGEVTIAATCISTGEKTYTCSVCNDSYKESIAKSSHKYTSKVTKAATFTSDGQKTYTCSVCNNTYNETISKTGHSYTSKVTKTATCASSGTRTYTCTTCNDSYKETIAATEHKWSDATCSSAKKCNNCGKTEGKALGHDYSNGKCKRCGEVPSAIFKLPSTPKTVYYRGSYSGKLYSSCEVTKISYSLTSSYGGELDYKFTFEGKCTYNSDGNNVSDSMKIGYKLYDSDGVVVKSGTIWTENVAVGEKFKETITFYDLIPGETYRLEILDVS